MSTLSVSRVSNTTPINISHPVQKGPKPVATQHNASGVSSIEHKGAPGNLGEKIKRAWNKFCESCKKLLLCIFYCCKKTKKENGQNNTDEGPTLGMPPTKIKNPKPILRKEGVAYPEKHVKWKDLQSTNPTNEPFLNRLKTLMEMSLQYKERQKNRPAVAPVTNPLSLATAASAATLNPPNTHVGIASQNKGQQTTPPVAAPVARAPSLATLPVVVQRNICSFLGPRDLASLSRVCRGTNQAADHPQVWRNLQNNTLDRPSDLDFIEAQKLHPKEFVTRGWNRTETLQNLQIVRDGRQVLKQIPISFTKNVTTIGELKSRLRKAFNDRAQELNQHLREKLSLIEPGHQIELDRFDRRLDPHPDFPGSFNYRPLQDHEICSDVLPDYLQDDGSAYVPHPEIRVRWRIPGFG